MTGSDLVRASRDGDQFHYMWAARQCLRLLPGGSDLIAVTVEGASPLETAGTLHGEELIDVGLYYGSEIFGHARQVHYRQLKHSTLQSSVPWPPSGLEKTIRGFAERYKELRRQYPKDVLAGRLRFGFTTNRPITLDVLESLQDLSAGRKPRRATTAKKLVQYTELEQEEMQPFFALLSIHGGEDDLWVQRNLLQQELTGYLPDADVDAPVQLKELVTRKATTEFETNPRITRHDVLRALKADEDTLLPAPRLIPAAADAIPREQEPAIRAEIRNASGPIIIHADGGVGKSVLASRLADEMEAGSYAILYDCFGNGLYRSVVHARHRHKDALVQIANELAARGYCHPLIPTVHADAKAYTRAFLYRLEQAVRHLRAATPDALLCIVIDAADNAQMAAEEQKEVAAFIRDLLRVPLPEGVRLVATCRSHRRHLLNPPAGTCDIRLRPFTLEESARHLRSRHPEASSADVAEFAHLSSHNPRVQALALSRELSLPRMLARLGPQPTTVEAAIGELLEGAVARLRDEAGAVEASQVDRICAGLAVLRPLIPIQVLAAMSGVSDGAVRSFALDMGRPLLLTGDSVQFFDEPAETWFRDRFRPSKEAVTGFIETLRPFSAASAYVASAIPQLLLEAGHLRELVDLALSGEGLPTNSPLEKRDVELQRLMFALKAALRAKDYSAAAKLALKTAGETAGEGRQSDLIQSNAALASALMSASQVEEIVSRRPFGAAWQGSHHAYDAAFMSGHAELIPEASSRLRMAMGWLHSWAGLSGEDRSKEDFTDEDRAALALALLRLRGGKEAATFLRRWRNRLHDFHAGAILVRDLVDLDELAQVDALAYGARNDAWLLLGIVDELRRAGRLPPERPLRRLLRLLGSRRVSVTEDDRWDHQWKVLAAVTSAIECAALLLPSDFPAWAAILRRYLPNLPPKDLASRFANTREPLLRAYAVLAALDNKLLQLVDLAHDELRKELQSDRYSTSQETSAFKEDVGSLLPWHRLSAQVVFGRVTIPQLDAAIEAATKESRDASRHVHREFSQVADGKARQWLAMLADAGVTERAPFDRLRHWVEARTTPLAPSSLVQMARRIGRLPGLEDHSLHYASAALRAYEQSREDASTRCEALVELARAIFPVSRAEAGAYFDTAVEVASRIGEENLDRWRALLDLAGGAADVAEPRPQVAYRVARAAELTYEYVVRDKHFDWESTVEAITDLCPSSALTILSRWRDRRFGETGRVLAVATDRLVAQGRISPAERLALAGVEAPWDRLRNLQEFLEGEPDEARRRAGAAVAWRYLRVELGTLSQWERLASLAAAHDLDFPDLHRLRTQAETTDEAVAKSPRTAGHGVRAPREDDEPPWDALFSSVELDSPDSLYRALLTVRDWGNRFNRYGFLEQACSRVRPGREADFVRAFTAVPEFGLYDLSTLLKAMPAGWFYRVSLRGALRSAVLEVCRRDPTHVSRHWWMQTFPLGDLESRRVVTDEEIVDATLVGLTEVVETLGAGALFSAIDFIAAKLPPTDAHEALHYGLDLLDDLLTEQDGDGPWRSVLEPPSTVAEALAGYCWAGLASPIASVRWEFAHAVRGLVELGCEEPLDRLFSLAERGEAGAFRDQGLAFYAMHARQWLLIGLARGALENPVLVKAAEPLLRQWSATEHVIIRGLSAEALLALAQAGVLAADAAERETWASINRSPRAPSLHHGYGGALSDEGASDEAEAAADEESFFFGIDIGPYWFAPLGRCFGVSEAAVERRARRAMREHLRWTGRGGWKDDERYKRRIFDDRETHHSHGSRPNTDALRDYQAYHAMLFTAGALLRELPVRRDEEDADDEFTDWLRREMLTRDDGRWLSDRRDPLLVAQPPWPTEYGDKTWRWAVTPNHLDSVLTTDDARCTLWGYWNSLREGREETVRVQSALVSEPAADALLAALQTAEDLSYVYLPEAGSENDAILSPKLSLLGWVRDPDRSRGLDDKDAWAEGLRYSGPVPSTHVVSRLMLRPDPDRRWWDSEIAGPSALRTESWARTYQHGRDKETESGTRMSASPSFLKALLDGSAMCLIVAVRIRRSERRSYYAGEKDDMIEYPWPYARLHLVRADGVRRSL